MEKVAVSVDIPALNNTYDFMIPSSMSVRDIIDLITKILISEYGLRESADSLVLIDSMDGKMLRSDCTFTGQGIADGAKLILI